MFSVYPKEALDQSMASVYDDLRRLAHHYLRRERPEHTLQPTALVNEAYIRLASSKVAWHDRAHFFAVAARLMGHLLVDYARTRQRAKRDHGVSNVSLDEVREAPVTRAATRYAHQILAARDRIRHVRLQDRFGNRLIHAQSTAEDGFLRSDCVERGQCYVG